MPKSLFASKAFWLNVAGLLAAVGGVLPPEYAVYALAVGNVIVRLMTSQPIEIPGLRE